MGGEDEEWGGGKAFPRGAAINVAARHRRRRAHLLFDFTEYRSLGPSGVVS